MTVDPEDGLVTNLMLAVVVAFGADIVLFVGILWALGYASTSLFATSTVLVVAFFAAWIGWRWWQLRRLESTERTPVEELQYQYASGNISEAEFERRLDAIVETENLDDETFESGEFATEE